MKGVWPDSYLQNPNPQKPIHEIWDDFDAYSYEELYELPEYHKSISLHVPFPPLKPRIGRLIKGVCFSQCAHLLIHRYPCLKKMFHVCANSMCCGYPWSHDADCFFTCHRYPERERYYKEKYPKTKNIICIPLQDADYTNEKIMQPIPDTPKTIDVFGVSTAFPVKNLPLIAQALKIYEQKYHYRLKVVYAIGSRDAKKNPDGSLDYSGVMEYAKKQLRAVDAVLGDTKAYIDFIPYIEYRDLPRYFSAARCGVLASLIEGKNRFLHEGMCCDMPVIAFRQLNQFVRGNEDLIFENCGEYIPEFTPESMADTIYYVLNHPEKYNPRENYLKRVGRKNFAQRLLAEIPYYRRRIPRYRDGNVVENKWVNKTCKRLYGLDYESFLYDKKYQLSNLLGFEEITKALKEYCALSHIPFEENTSPPDTALKS